MMGLTFSFNFFIKVLVQRYLPLNEHEFSMDRSRKTVQTQLTLHIHYGSGDSCQASDEILGLYTYFMCEEPEENAQVLVTYI